MLALTVLVVFALLGVVDLASLVSRNGRPLRAIVLERTALLTGSLAMVVMAVLMLSGMPGDFAGRFAPVGWSTAEGRDS